MLARRLRNERRNVVDQGRVDDGIIGRGDECGRGSAFYRERGHRGNHVLLQFNQFGGRLCDKAALEWMVRFGRDNGDAPCIQVASFRL